MKKSLLLYLIWLILVVIWNFGYPTALPVYDVLAAIILSILVKYLDHYLKSWTN